MFRVDADELQMFTHCQVRWLFQYIYKVKHRLSIEEGFENATRAAAKVMISKIYQHPETTFEDFLPDWRALCETQGVHCGATDTEIEHMRTEGAYHLGGLFARLKRTVIVAVNLPWESEWEMIDYTVRGAMMALVTGNFEPSWAKSKESLYVLELPNPGTRLHLRKTGLRLLHMARASLVCESKELSHKANAVRTVVVHPATGGLQLLESESPQWVMPLVGNVLNMMHFRLVTPNEGPHCTTCPFQKVCNIRYYNREAVSSPQLTGLKMEEELK
jgi:hypothetical protein